MLSHALKFMSNDCFGHAFLVTVKITGIPPRCRHCLREVLERILFPWSLFLRSRTPRAGVADPESGMGLDRLLGRPQFNYEPFNSNSINICSWSWNYRGCWHQTFPPMATLRVIYTQIMENRQKTIPPHRMVWSHYSLSLPPRIEIG